MCGGFNFGIVLARHGIFRSFCPIKHGSMMEKSGLNAFTDRFVFLIQDHSQTWRYATVEHLLMTNSFFVRPLVLTPRFSRLVLTAVVVAHQCGNVRAATEDAVDSLVRLEGRAVRVEGQVVIFVVAANAREFVKHVDAGAGEDVFVADTGALEDWRCAARSA